MPGLCGAKARIRGAAPECTLTPKCFGNRPSQAQSSLKADEGRQLTPLADNWSACATEMPKAAREGAKGRRSDLPSCEVLARPTATGRRLTEGTVMCPTQRGALAPRLQARSGQAFYFVSQSCVDGMVHEL